MGHIKNRIEQLRQQEQLSGWVDRKLGEAQLVSDALDEGDRTFVDQLVERRENGNRNLGPGEAARVHALHATHVHPALTHAVQYETNAERAERAKDQQKKGGARAPEANEDLGEAELKDKVKKGRRS